MLKANDIYLFKMKSYIKSTPPKILKKYKKTTKNIQVQAYNTVQ